MMWLICLDGWMDERNFQEEAVLEEFLLLSM